MANLAGIRHKWPLVIFRRCDFSIRAKRWKIFSGKSFFLIENILRRKQFYVETNGALHDLCCENDLQKYLNFMRKLCVKSMNMKVNIY
jgi:hypothetical protein